MAEPVRVCITGAAGQIAYSLIFMIGKGEAFGTNQRVIIHLLDIPGMENKLQGVAMEIEDCALPLVAGVVPTTNYEEAFKDVSYCLLVGAMPRREGMLRKDLLEKNAGIFKGQGAAINTHAKKDVKILVVGNPANTNARICMEFAPDIPKENFSCLTRLDHNRAKAQVAKKLGITNANDVSNVIIWGNHSSTQFPDLSHAVVNIDGKQVPAKEALKDDAWVQSEFVETVQQRGAAVIKARELSSAASASQAICDHMRNWVLGTSPGETVSMGVYSTGSGYNVPDDLIFSFPVTCSGGSFTIVKDLQFDDFSKAKLEATAKELQEEKDTALANVK